MQKKSIFLLILFLLQLIFSAVLTRNHLYSYHFVDEDEFILGGKLINEQEKPYADFYIQHQPFPYYLSAILQHSLQEPDVRTAIKIHRMFIWGWNALWGIVLFMIHPLVAVLFVGLWEIVKFDLFGSLFLADSLVAYPVIVCIALIITQARHHTLTHREAWVGLIALTIIVTTWQIGWFFALWWLVLILSTLGRDTKRLKFIFYTSLGISTFLVCILLAISFPLRHWFSTMIIGNADDCMYMFDSCSLGVRIVSGLFYPFSTAGHLFTAFHIEPFIAFIFLLSILVLLSQKPYRKTGLALFICIMLLALRPLDVTATMYEGFHKLPLLGSMVYTTLCLPILFGYKRLSGLFFIMFVSIALYTKPYFLQTVSPEHEYTIQFSRFEKYASMINHNAQPGDTLFVMPDEMFVYYLSKPQHASRFIFYLEWMVDKKVYKEEIRNLFNTTPPTWVYADANNRKNITEEQKILLTGYEGIDVDRRNDLLYRRKTD